MNSSNKGPSNKKKGRSKKAHVLAASVETATLNFLEKGDNIAKESQFLKEELTAAVEDVRKQGKRRTRPLSHRAVRATFRVGRCRCRRGSSAVLKHQPCRYINMTQIW